jgi:hypothetical protein
MSAIKVVADTTFSAEVSKASDADREFAVVAGRIIRIRTKSIRFAIGGTAPRQEWVPLAHVHEEDRRTLSARRPGEEIQLRIKRWKARELHFIAEHETDDDTPDLFEGKAS